MEYEGIKGLTAKDRADWEKLNLEELTAGGYNNFNEQQKDEVFKAWAIKAKYGHRDDYSTFKALSGEKLDSVYNTVGPDDPLTSLDNYTNTVEEISYNNFYKDNSFNDKWNDIDKFLQENSKTYRDWGNSLLWKSLGPEEITGKKMQLTAEYEADVQYLGESAANQNLLNKVQDEISTNLTQLDRITRTVGGWFATLTGATISSLGSIGGLLTSPIFQSADAIVSSIADEETLKEYRDIMGYIPSKDRNFFEQWTIDFVNNPITRFGNSVIKTGTFWEQFNKDLNKEKNINEIIRPSDELNGDLWDKMLSINTLYESAQQSGYMASDMFIGGGLSLISKVAFANKAANLISGTATKNAVGMEMLNGALEKLSRNERIVNSYILPGFSGTLEGAVNALETQQRSLQSFNNQLEEQIQSIVNQRLEQQYAQTINEQGENVASPAVQKMIYDGLKEKIDAEVRLEFADQIEDAKSKAVYNSETALMFDLTLNSFVNGFVNKTFQAAQLGDRVKNSVQRTSVGKLFEGNKYAINPSGDVIANTIGFGRKTGRALKEVGGEFIEEYSQTVSSDVTTAGGEYDFNNYLSQRFNGVAEDAIVEDLAGTFSHVFNALGKSVTSREAIEAGIYGALGSAQGNINVHTIYNLPGTIQNIASKEGIWGKSKALVDALYRNPIVDSWRDSNTENNTRQQSAKAINDWLNRDGNREKFTTMKGILGFANSMSEASEEGDEFSYRNSKLGMSLSSFFMLEQLKGTRLYDAWVQQHLNILNAKEGDQIAKDVEEATGMKFAEVQENVKKSMELMNKVQTHTQELEKVFGGTVPQHLKEALIFGKISLEDWKARGLKIEEKFKELGIDYSSIKNMIEGYKEHYGLSDKAKHRIAINGSVENKAIKKQLDAIEKEIQTLESNRELLNKKNRERLVFLKKLRKQAQKQYNKEEKEVSDINQEIESKGTEALLSAEEIMALSPTDRYYMLNPQNRKFYSEKQQEIIEGLEAAGNTADAEYMNLIEDAARLENAQIDHFNRYNEALKDPRKLESINYALGQKARYEDKQKEYKKLNDISTYEEFVDVLDGMMYEGLDNISVKALSNTLKDNQYWNLYKASKEMSEKIATQLLKNDKFKDVSIQDKQIVKALTDYMIKKGISIEDTNAVINTLDSIDSEGNSTILNHLENINKKLPKDNQLSLDNLSNVISLYKDAVLEYKKNDEVKQKVEQKPSVQEVKPENNSNIFNSPEVQADNSYLLSEQDKKAFSDEISKAYDDIVSYIENLQSPTLDAQQKKVLIHQISDILRADKGKDERTIKDINDFVLAIYKSKELIKTLSLGTMIKNKLYQTIDLSIKHLKDKYNLQLDDNIQLNTTTSQETSLDSTNSKVNLIITDSEDSELERQLKEWKVLEYLKNNDISGRGRVNQIFFTYKEINGKPYIVAVLKDGKGPLNIRGISCQPIGVISRVDSLGKLFEQAKANEGDFIIKGNVQISSNAVVKKSSPEISISKDTDTPLENAVKNSMSEEELSGESNVPRIGVFRDAYTESPYITKLKNFISKWFVKKDGNKTSGDNIKLKVNIGDEEIIIISNSIEETRNKEGKLLLEVAGSSNPFVDILNFNHFTREVGQALKHLVTKAQEEITDSHYLIWSEGKLKWNDGSNFEYADKINTYIQRYIYSSNANEVIKLKPESKGSPSIAVYLGDIKLGVLTNNINDKNDIPSDETIGELVYNILIDTSGRVRNSLNWQVDKPLGEITDSKRREWLDAAKDGVFRLPVDSIDPIVNSVSVTLPSTVIPNIPTPQNPPTADTGDTIIPSGNKDINIETPEGIMVDPNTGRGDNGQKGKNISKTPKDKAKEIVNTINEDSEDFEIDDTSNTYRQKSTGQHFYRATSLINKKQYGNNLYNTVSTFIGNLVDSFVRGIMGHNVQSIEHPNLPKRQSQNFKDKVEELRNKLESKGHTIVAQDVTVSGTIKDGEELIPVAGTLDLLTYDSEGNFHIYDMKTHIWNTLTPEKEREWKEQLTIYKKLLEQKYGVTVKSLHIIPIKVDYATPDRKNIYSVENDILKLNGNTYTITGIKLEGTLDYEEVELSINRDNLGVLPDSQNTDSTINNEEEKNNPIEVVSSNTEVSKEVVPDSNDVLMDMKIEFKPSKPTENKDSNKEDNNPVDDKNWDSLDEETRKILSETMQYTKEIWDNLALQVKKDMLSCI